MSEENINCINIKCHDLKRQIELMRKTGENEEKEKIIDELDDMVMIYDSEFIRETMLWTFCLPKKVCIAIKTE